MEDNIISLLDAKRRKEESEVELFIRQIEESEKKVRVMDYFEYLSRKERYNNQKWKYSIYSRVARFLGYIEKARYYEDISIEADRNLRICEAILEKPMQL